VGCADGRFTLSISPNFGYVHAIDFSEGMLESARKAQEVSGITNVKFEKADLFKNNLPSGEYDLIYCRRGPTDYGEFYRLLKSGGYYLEIKIGEKDAQEIKEVFGRGQGFGKWNQSVSEKVSNELKEAGINPTYVADYTYNEYYESQEDLNRFLLSVPIFEDYDPLKDKVVFEKYVKENTSEKGIKLPRHRVVVIARKQ
jgi:ubiquinone/menaquinone biosynthesis C-methylase UbiE